MDEEKHQAYTELATKLTELHASVALMAHHVEKVAKTDTEVTEMTRIFHDVFKNAAEKPSYCK